MGGKKVTGPKVLAVCNQKGGVGKTFTSVQVASIMAHKHQKKVLLIDGDYQANASSILGVKNDARRAKETLADGLLPFADMKRTRVGSRYRGPGPNAKVTLTRWEGLHCLAGSLKLNDFNSKPYNPYALKSWLDIEKNFLDYDYIIIDTHPDVSHTFANIMTLAQYYIIPVFAEADAFDGLQIMFDSIDHIQTNFNPTLHLLGVVITRFDQKNATHKKFYAALQELSTQKKIKILGTCRQSATAQSSADAKVPLCHLDKRINHLLADYEKLTEKLIKELRVRRGRTPETPLLEEHYADKLAYDLSVTEQDMFNME